MPRSGSGMRDAAASAAAKAASFTCCTWPDSVTRYFAMWDCLTIRECLPSYGKPAATRDAAAGEGCARQERIEPGRRWAGLLLAERHQAHGWAKRLAAVEDVHPDVHA